MPGYWRADGSYSNGSSDVQVMGSNLQQQKTQADATGVKEAASLTINAVATAAGNVTVTLDGVATNVAVALNDTAIQVADKIRAATFTGWVTGGTTGTATVTFTATTFGNKADAAYSAGTTGATGAMTTTAQGTNAGLTFSANIGTVEIYNTDSTNAGVFVVNGISINVPAGKVFKSSISGTPNTQVTVSGATTYIVSRYT